MNMPHAFTRAGLAALLAAACLGPLATAALAQGKNVPNALQGFAANRDAPIRINANSLEVRDQEKQAVFSGNVVVQQGDTTMRCKELVVFYDGKEAGGKEAGGKEAGGKEAAAPSSDALAAGSPINSSAIRRLEINGSVVVTTKEQTATGDQGVFETKANTITLTGNPVVLTSGPNVIRGKKLTVDLTSGLSRFDGGRIESLIVPNSMGNGGGLPGAKPAAPAAKPKPAP
ncbi:LptA/OstA family protein [Ancylobacter vacuolatus]|uniref:Lipopolysaccharide export system protein LptA n=1 Tax=Ancylobacter vacuolatus TaxID=223389 RepID=A0ABU0DGT2_9HYPH|nr:LptA/OstA family protein [Ancylobacter vacuolatus]MDQ0347640.1 lipopolysaccharide export system protein LptA [Ancylobacter vacuolatus]